MNKPVLLSLGLALITSLPAFAYDDDEKPVSSPDELSQWCKHLVEQNHLPQNQLPRNWRESPVVKGDYYKTKLVYRIDYDDYEAECTVRAGAQRKYVVLNLLGKR